MPAGDEEPSAAPVIRITRAACRQIENLLRYYLYELEPARPEAALGLLCDLADARKRIVEQSDRGRTYPAAYENLKEFGFLWVRMRAYWVSWCVVSGVPAVTNVFYISARIDDRATPNVEDIQDTCLVSNNPRRSFPQ